jgi:DNA (cytosine-5)-methyltransferase 1
MPEVRNNGLATLSLFSGGGGLDLGFERAGYTHAASVELLDVCGETLKTNRPDWQVLSGDQDGDVQTADWFFFRGVDVVQGGPPCQPFSTAGKQAGDKDPRNMWPEFVRCVLEVKPRAFIAENVPGLLDKKFSAFVERNIVGPLGGEYEIRTFALSAHEFGVPQARRRVFFVGFRNRRDALRFAPPLPTHIERGGLFAGLPFNTARSSLGLEDIGFDAVAPTLRSGFTGPRNTTGVVNSRASLAIWNKLQIWPNGVQPTRHAAAAYPPENGHHRLSIADCALLQGFPEGWRFSGAVYQALGQIGNSVCPPVGYSVARAVARALGYN